MFGTWLKQHRKQLDLTQGALADQVGCSVATVRKIETNQRRPSRQFVERLARFLEIPANDLPTFVSFARNGGQYCPQIPLTAAAAERDQTLSKPSSNLPFWPTRLLGREQLIAATRARLLDDDVRLLTLTGPPGIGKTRLGVQIAQASAGAFADGVCFVGLAPLRDPALLLMAIAQALGLHTAADQSFQASLKTYLREKRLLLLLDNFEHLPAAAPLVGELLAAAPGLKLLVTSRAKLHLYGEHEFPIPPLALPNLADLPATDDLPRCYPSVALFVARARAARPDFALTEANAPIVAEICVRLDGLPLAIELAAARSKLLNPPALLARLTSRLDLLTGGACDLPERQRALRNMIGWSYDLLTTDERRLLRRLGVFLGGCSIEAAAAVCQDALLGGSARGSQNGHAAPTIIEQVDALIHHSLLHQGAGVDDPPRYVLLETIREYALERLTADGEIDAIRQQHAAYFLQFAQQAESKLNGPDQAEWLDQLEQDHDNLRAALAWLLERKQAELGLRLAGALAEFWLVRGYFAEGRTWLERFLEVAPTFTAARAKALYGLGTLARRQGDFAVAQRCYEDGIALSQERGDKNNIALGYIGLGEWAIVRENSAVARTQIEKSLALFRELENKQGIARAFAGLAAIAQSRGKFTAAREYIELSLELYRELQDIGRIAWMVYRLGVVAHHQKNPALERTCCEESLALWQTLGDQRGVAFSLTNLGLIALAERKYAQARDFWDASLARFQKLGDRNGIGMILGSLGDLARVQGDMPQAKVCYEAALKIYEELAETSQIAKSLRNLGYVARHQGDCGGATRLFHASLALCQRMGSPADIGLCLIGLADVAATQRQLIQAARLFGAADGLFGASCTFLGTVDQLNHQRSLAIVRVQLGAHHFTNSWNEGRAMSLEQVIVYASTEMMPQDPQPAIALL